MQDVRRGGLPKWKSATSRRCCTCELLLTFSKGRLEPPSHLYIHLPPFSLALLPPPLNIRKLSGGGGPRAGPRRREDDVCAADTGSEPIDTAWCMTQLHDERREARETAKQVQGSLQLPWTSWSISWWHLNWQACFGFLLGYQGLRGQWPLPGSRAPAARPSPREPAIGFRGHRGRNCG